jgi:hypothetical protein
LIRAAQLLAGIVSCGTLAQNLTTPGAAWTLIDQWNYAEYQLCLLGGNKSMRGTSMSSSVAERLVKDMIKVQIAEPSLSQIKRCTHRLSQK